MNRAQMILLAVAMTTLVLTSGAEAYTMERMYPTSASVFVPATWEAQILTFQARFGGLAWPYIWHQADWYWDGELWDSDDGLGGQTVDSYCLFLGTEIGTHTIKVRAKYDSVPFGVHVWTDYLTWTLTIVDPETYTMERVNPAQESCTVPLTTSPEFKASLGGLVSQGAWDKAQWYVDGELKKTEAMSGQSDDSFFYPPFTTVGTHKVKVNALYRLGAYPVTTRDLAWTVEVVPHPPTASRVSPDSPVTLQKGGTQAFTASGADPGAETDTLDIAGVRWYLNGVQQSDSGFGMIDESTIEHTWSRAFDVSGTYQVEAVFYDYEGYSSTSGQAVWTIVVEGHDPSGTIVSPSSSVTVFQGKQETFTLRAMDSADDLRLCEVSLDGVFQTNASFSGAASGSTATWTHLFNTPGTYSVEFTPLDLGGDYGAICTWTVVVEAHDPVGTIVSPNSSVTVFQGTSRTFILEGADPADDLRNCEVSLDGAVQTSVSFNGAAGGGTAEWTCTFNTLGTHSVWFVPVDAAGNYGVACTWIVKVESASKQAGLNILVIGLDAQGAATGTLADATVELSGPGAATTATVDGQGQLALTGLIAGAYTLNVSRDGYYAQSRSVSLAAGETKDEVFRLTPESEEPAVFDFASPNGKHFIEGLPGDLSLSAVVAWSGSPGSVYFNVGGTSYPAKVTDLGGGKAQADLSVAIPSTISTVSELQVEVANGEGETTTLSTGVYLYPLPSIILEWFSENLPWETSGPAFYRRDDAAFLLWEEKIGYAKTKAYGGLQAQVGFDPRAGTFDGSIGVYGSISLTLDPATLNPQLPPIEYLGEGRLDLGGGLSIALAGYESPKITSSWRLSVSGKAGLGAPVVVVVGAVFPPAAPTIKALQSIPVVKDVVNGLKVRVYLILGLGMSGKYVSGEPETCFLGATSVSASGTLGLEIRALYTWDKWGGKVETGVYAGGTGTPELQVCPGPVKLKSVTFRAYVGVYVSAPLWRYSKEVGMTIQCGPKEGQEEGQLKILGIESTPQSDSPGGWQPVGDSCLRWGQTNLLAGERLYSLSAQGETSQETVLVENVVSLASPVLLCGSSDRLILFCLHDPNKPWYAATDLGAVRQADDQPWALDRIADDEAAEFSPSVVAADSGATLAAWERVSGDISDTNQPDQIAPHLEIVAAWLDPNTGLWSTPEQLTSNAVVDHEPMAIASAATCGILWIRNEESAATGDAASGDHLMFAKWSGNGWDQPQTLWSAQKSIANFAFVADGLGEGHVVLSVDEDGDPNSTTDCELYLLSTANGAWQTAVQLTSDAVEDAIPTLVAPDGVPMCVWSADGTLLYSALDDWNPREVYIESTLANEAPSLDAVTMPGGAVVAYTVQGPNGVDIVASFYDADLDCWSLPRQLTSDEDAETALSLAWDADELVIAYLKTQTLRSSMDVEIDGQICRLENVPQPGRTDLYVLQHALDNDLAVVSESLVVDAANPAPGTTATILATIENRGDLPLQDVKAVFYDGDPSNGGVAIGDAQMIPGTLIAGGKQDVSVAWSVPLKESSHEIFVAVDPQLAVDDRDRSNNEVALRTVLPDLTIETCRSTEVSGTTMALTARIVNTGVVPADGIDVSWRLGAADGEEIGFSAIGSLIAGGAYETTFTWDTTGRLNPGEHVQAFAVADPAGDIPESDETNNASSLAVFHSLHEP